MWQLLHLPVSPPPPPLHHQTCCLCAILPTSSSADWQWWGTGGQELNCMQHVAMSEFDIAIFVIRLTGLGEGYLCRCFIYLYWLSGFKGYSINVLISSRSCWKDTIGCALGCPQMLSHRDALFFLMINVCSGILYLLAPNRPVCSSGSVVRRLVVA